MHIRPITPADIDALGLITVTASHSVFIGAIPEEDIDFNWTPAVSAANWRRTFDQDRALYDQFWVAEEQGRVIAYVWSAPGANTPGFDWSVRGLYVLPTRQREGIGRTLLAFVADRLARDGVTTLEIGCVKENPSCGFYRHLGGAEVGRRPVAVDAYDTEEILFGWRDLAPLRSAALAEPHGPTPPASA